MRATRVALFLVLFGCVSCANSAVEPSMSLGPADGLSQGQLQQCDSGLVGAPGGLLRNLSYGGFRLDFQSFVREGWEITELPGTSQPPDARIAFEVLYAGGSRDQGTLEATCGDGARILRYQLDPSVPLTPMSRLPEDTGADARVDAGANDAGVNDGSVPTSAREVELYCLGPLRAWTGIFFLERVSSAFVRTSRAGGHYELHYRAGRYFDYVVQYSQENPNRCVLTSVTSLE